MPAASAIGLALLTFVIGIVVGRLMARSGPQVRSFGNEAGAGSFEAAQRRAMAASPPASPEMNTFSGLFADSTAGVTAGYPGTSTSSGGAGSFRVILTEPGLNKIKTVKAIREATHLDLKDSKDLSDRTPTLLARAASEAEANRIARCFDGIAAVRVEQD